MGIFTEDWISQHTEHWRSWLAKFAGKPNIKGLEIGSYEGRSGLWFLENILTHANSSLTCVDPMFTPSFEANLAPHSAKIQMIREFSGVALRDAAFALGSYHFVYIDGEHMAVNVLEDAILAFPLLVPGGIMIFDDYQWKSVTPNVPQSMPRIAIDAFITVFQYELRVLYQRWQVAIEKVSTAPEQNK